MSSGGEQGEPKGERSEDPLTRLFRDGLKTTKQSDLTIQITEQQVYLGNRHESNRNEIEIVKTEIRNSGRVHELFSEWGKLAKIIHIHGLCLVDRGQRIENLTAATEKRGRRSETVSRS